VLSTYERLLVKRFLFSKKTDGYISVFSWFSVIGIMIGVAAIIIVMSVMNGFREELTTRLLGINGHLNIYSQSDQIAHNEIKLINNLKIKNIKIFPLIETQALLISNETSKGVYLRGYENIDLMDTHFLNNKIVRGHLFTDNPNDIVIGYALANRLGLAIGEKIKIAIPKTDKTIFGNIPRFKTLQITGIFNVGMYEYDSNFVFTNPVIPRKLLMIENNNYNKIELFTQDPNNIEQVQLEIDNKIKTINNQLYSLSWKENNSSLINALNVEKNVMFLILTLIILVASMNIISGLIIFVKEKNKDIAILKTIGLSNSSLMKIFMSIGLLIGLIGTSLGGFLGVVFSINISSIQNILEKLFKTDLFAKEVYYLSSLPSRLDQIEVLYVVLISLIISLFATVFPAYRSSLIDPIKSLKND
ncbi:uncharacterized protein METZ01_LOCUS92356, partial [marine metagenome]